MLHLIKLELKKGKLSKFIWGGFLAYGIIALLLLPIYLVEGPIEEAPVFVSYSEMFGLIDTLIRATFIIYASAMVASLIISEFRDKTMSVLFAYPISRKKLIWSKLSIVFVWAVVNIILANVLISGIIIAFNSHFQYIDDVITTELLLKQGAFILTNAFASAGMSLLPLAIGMIKKSGTATILSSIFIVMVVCSNNMGFTLSSIIAIPISLGLLGLLLTYLSFRKIDRVDVA
ncbi:ABC transporter permease [Paenibacillus sp. GCM10027627]|uniref:ABC transporter permease n=1 Tax=unclassified Paenibacillus TaxID=185978 RepID=UPI003627F02A